MPLSCPIAIVAATKMHAVVLAKFISLSFALPTEDSPGHYYRRVRPAEKRLCWLPKSSTLVAFQSDQSERGTMNCRRFPLIVLLSIAASAASAQIAGCADAPPGSSSIPCPVDITARRSFDMASVER